VRCGNRLHPLRIWLARYSNYPRRLLNREIAWRILVPGLMARVLLTRRSETRASRSTSLLTMANRKLADNPHISTPMMLSTGLRSATSTEERHHRSRRSHSWQLRSRRQIPTVESKPAIEPGPKQNL